MASRRFGVKGFSVQVFRLRHEGEAPNMIAIHGPDAAVQALQKPARFKSILSTECEALMTQR